MPKKYTITPLSEFPLKNNFMFGQVMHTEEICKLFLEALLEIEIERIEFLDRQKDFADSYEYHGIRLDMYLNLESSGLFIALWFTLQTDDEKREGEEILD